jgi:competence protein ComEC
MQPALTRSAAWLADRANRVAEAERGRAAPFLAVALAAGAALYYALGTEPPGRIGPWLAAGGLALVLLSPAWRSLRALGLLAASLGLGFALAQWSTERMPPQPVLPTRATIVTATIAKVELLPLGRRLTLERPSLNDGPELARNLRIRLHRADSADVTTGERIRLRAMLQPPSGAPLPGGWDIQFDAYHTGLAGYGYALGPLERLAPAAPSGMAAWFQALQEAMAARVHAALPGATGRVAASLMVGGQGAIAAADQQAFRDSGLSHLLSISGLHLAIAMGLVFAAVRLLLAAVEWTALHWPVKAIAALAALASGTFYTLLTGAQVPMLRSLAGAALVTFAILVGRRALSLRSWALALAVVAAAAPYEVARVSFQMSFAATLALVAGFEALRPWLARLAADGRRVRKLAAWLVALALTSALAGTASAPFGAYHFGAVQLYYVAANMVAVPLTSVLVMPAAVAAMLLMPLGLEWLALVPMGWGVDGILAIARHVAAWPQAVVPVPQIAPWGLAAYSLGLAWLALWRTRLRLLGLAGIAAGLLSATLYVPPDVLVSGDARLIALRAGSTLYVQRTQSGSDFVLSAWLARLGLRDWQPLPLVGATDPGGALACDTGGCTLHLRPGGPTARLLRGPAGAGDCAHALVIAAEPLRLDCPVAFIDRFSVWREGAHAAWLEPDKVRILSDRTNRGDRPWVTKLPTRSRQPSGPLLPPAQADGE